MKHKKYPPTCYFPPLYTEDGTEVPYPYTNTIQCIQHQPEPEGIQPPQIIEDKLVFQCGEFTVKSKPYKHGYTNDYSGQKNGLGVYRETDKNSRKQISEYVLEEIQITKPVINQDIRVLSKGVTIGSWLNLLGDCFTFIFRTHYGDRIQIPSTYIYNRERNPFLFTNYLQATRYKVEQLQEVDLSLREFLLLTMNRIYYEYSQELFNFVHDNTLNAYQMITDLTIELSDEGLLSIDGDALDERTHEKIHDYQLTVLFNDEELETTEHNNHINKVLHLNLDDPEYDDTVTLIIRDSLHDEYRRVIDLNKLGETETRVTIENDNNDIYVTENPEDLTLQVTDNEGNPVNKGIVNMEIEEITNNEEE